MSEQNKFFNERQVDKQSKPKVKYFKSVNWNEVEDTVDKLTWEKLVMQFWTDTRIPVSNDLEDWRKLSQAEQDMLGKVFGGLTLLDTLQSEEAGMMLIKDARNQKEVAVYANQIFMEAMHAKSYSTIFITLNNNREIEDIFDWIDNNDLVQDKAKMINDVYQNGTPLQRKVASVFLESFLFYSGFYAPLWYLGNNKIPNVAEIIKLINQVSLGGNTSTK